MTRAIPRTAQEQITHLFDTGAVRPGVVESGAMIGRYIHEVTAEAAAVAAEFGGSESEFGQSGRPYNVLRQIADRAMGANLEAGGDPNALALGILIGYIGAQHAAGGEL